MNNKAILLIRVSTVYQDTDPQKDSLTLYANNLGFNTLHIIETKESGLADIADRAGLEELFDFLKKNPAYRTVFASEMSRVSRRQSVLGEVKDFFVKEKIQLYIKDTSFALLDENGNLSQNGNTMFVLYGLFAENEIANKKFRFLQKRQYDMKNGINIAGKNLFGYKKIYENKKSVWVVDEVNALIVRKIFSWYISGIDNDCPNPSISRITQECIRLNFPHYTHSKRNINKLLKEKGYTGSKITNNKTKVVNPDGTVTYKYTQNEIKYPSPKIIEDEIFNLVQAKLLSKNTNAEKASKHITILSRLIKCSACGNHFMGEYKKKDTYSKNTYRCSSRTKINPKCSNKQSISMNLIDSVIWQYITQRQDLIKIIETINPDDAVVGLEHNIAEYEKKISNLTKLISEANNYMADLSKRKRFSDAQNVLDEITKLEKKLKGNRGALTKLEKKISEIKNSSELIDRLISRIDENEISKSLVKKYINFLIKEINILFHNKKYSIIKINKRNFIDYKNETTYNMSNNCTFIIIDKSTTLKPFVIITDQIIDIEGDNIFIIDSDRPKDVKTESYISLIELFSQPKNGSSQIQFFRQRLDLPTVRYNPFSQFKVLAYKKQIFL